MSPNQSRIITLAKVPHSVRLNVFTVLYKLVNILEERLFSGGYSYTMFTKLTTANHSDWP